jgi:hypothetical protein
MSNLISLRVWVSTVIRFGITPSLLKEQQRSCTSLIRRGIVDQT